MCHSNGIICYMFLLSKFGALIFLSRHYSIIPPVLCNCFIMSHPTVSSPARRFCVLQNLTLLKLKVKKSLRLSLDTSRVRDNVGLGSYTLCNPVVISIQSDHLIFDCGSHLCPVPTILSEHFQKVQTQEHRA